MATTAVEDKGALKPDQLQPVKLILSQGKKGRAGAEKGKREFLKTE